MCFVLTLGVLLPGDELEFPFYFKSLKPGIFSEMWILATSPVLNKGRPLLVILKGVACQDDLFKERRDEIEVRIDGVNWGQTPSPVSLMAEFQLCYVYLVCPQDPPQSSSSYV